MQEILLTRIFSFTIWYHLAYLTISTALLGFGAAGSVLAAWPGLYERNPERSCALAAAAAGVSLLVAAAVLGANPISPDIMLEAPGRFSLHLFAYYATVTVPFFLAGVAVATPLCAFPTSANRLYAADLLGAAIGCACAVAALSFADGPGAIALCAGLLVLGGASYTGGGRDAVPLAVLGVLLCAGSPLADRVIEFVPTHTKAMGRAIREPGTEMLFTRWSPVNRVDVYRTRSQLGGWWSLRGLSPTYKGPRPPTLSIQYDAHNGTDIYDFRMPAMLRMFDHHLLATPYESGPRSDVLIIGVGGGIDVQNAIYHRAERVTAVDLQPITIELHRGLLKATTGAWMARDGVRLVAGEGRHFVRSHGSVYDLIQITAVDTFSAQSTGAYVLAESYLYTIEAFEDYLGHLEPDGVVSVILGDLVTQDPDMPPPLLSRLVGVARRALANIGVDAPARHLVAVAQRAPSIWTSGGRETWIQNLLVKRTPFTPAELARVRGHAERNGFEVRLSPAGSRDPALARVAGAPWSASPFADHPHFEIEPTSDEKPFFFNVLRWRSLLSGEDILWIFPGSSVGLLILALMLGQAVVVGGLLIGLPLLRLGGPGLPAGQTLRYLLYFAALGLGFLLIEISFVQKYVLLLGYPTYSLSVTILSLLSFAALGAYLCRRGWDRPRRLLALLLLATASCVLLELSVMSWIRDAVLGRSLAFRIAVTVALQLPLGLVLGMYFPTGLELVRREAPRLIPWAWAINGVTSVAGSVVAVMLGMAVGFSGVAFVALGIYALGTLALLSALPADSA